MEQRAALAKDYCQKLYEQGIDAFVSYHVWDGISLVRAFLPYCINMQLSMQIDAIESDYRSMLHFVQSGGKDESRIAMQQHVVCQGLSILDSLHRQLRLERNIDAYARAGQAAVAIDYAQVGSAHDAQTEIFNHLWTSPLLLAPKANAILQFLKQQTHTSKRFYLGALTLALWEYFDEQKMKILAAFMEDSQSEVRAQATVGYSMALLRHENRLPFYPDIAALPQTAFVADEWNVLQHFLLVQQNCMAIGEKIQQAIMHYKADASQQGFAQMMEDMADSDLTKRMQDGIDLNPHTFVMAYSEPFFHEVAAWWLPYEADSASTQYKLTHSANKLMAKTHAILSRNCCDVDLHAVLCVLNRRDMSLNTAALANFTEHTDMEKVPLDAVPKQNVYARILQNLFRFFHYSRYGKTLPNLFEMDLFLPSHTAFLAQIKEKGLRPVFAMLVRNECFKQAIQCGDFLIQSGGCDFRLLCDCGHCQQILGNYTAAIHHYRQAEFLAENDEWLLSHMAQCYRQMKYYAEANDCYERLTANDEHAAKKYLPLQAECKWNMGDMEGAMQCYFGMKYHGIDLVNALRGIARCALELRDYGKASLSITEVIAEHSPQPEDYILNGHIEWALADRWQLAVGSYKNALSRMGNANQEAMDFIFRDSKLLTRLGISHQDMMLMCDILFARD